MNSNAGVASMRFEATSCRPDKANTDVPQLGAVACYKGGNRLLTWRAPSSPHLACGLNVSFFLHTRTGFKLAAAGGPMRVSRV